VIPYTFANHPLESPIGMMTPIAPSAILYASVRKHYNVLSKEQQSRCCVSGKNTRWFNHALKLVDTFDALRN